MKGGSVCVVEEEEEEPSPRLHFILISEIRKKQERNGEKGRRGRRKKRGRK